jgi:Flp pilus assembly pilin Flp
MIRFLQHFLRDEQGGPAAEFALVLPILIIFLLGTIDVGRLMWEWNKAEKATQMGVRFAVVHDIVPQGLVGKNYSFAIDGGVLQGKVIDTSVFGGVSCQGTSVTCSCIDSAACDTKYLSDNDQQAFDDIWKCMQNYKWDVEAANVVVEYGASGLGFAGDPNPDGPDVAPLVKIRLINLEFQPLLTQIFGTTIKLPDFSAALTLEDGFTEEKIQDETIKCA